MRSSLPKKADIESHLEGLIIEGYILVEDHEVGKLREMTDKILHEINVFENAGYNLRSIKEQYSDLLHIYSCLQ